MNKLLPRIDPAYSSRTYSSFSDSFLMNERKIGLPKINIGSHWWKLPGINFVFKINFLFLENGLKEGNDEQSITLMVSDVLI